MKFQLASKFILLLPALFIFKTTLFSQIKYEKGYIIDKDNQRIECLIKNTDARKTPHSFSYRLTEESKPVTVTSADVKEVAISGYNRYISAKVKMDTSSDNTREIDRVSSSRDPEWKVESLFLKVLVDAKAATLYVYNETDLIRFFYSKTGSPIEQLIYKPFRVNESGYDYNKEYLNQLTANVSCTSTDPSGQSPDYNYSNLERYFIAFNACNGSPIAAAPKPPKTKLFSISLLAGVEQNSFKAQDGSNGVANYGSKTSPAFGAEFEYALPFNRNKISLVLSINNSSYKSSGKDRYGMGQVTYGSIATGIGPRFRFFCGNDFSIFLDALLVTEFKTSGSFNYFQLIGTSLYIPFNSVNVTSGTPIFGGGAGCAYKNFSAELRYLGSKDILASTNVATSSLTRLSFTVKYRILNF